MKIFDHGEASNYELSIRKKVPGYEQMHRCISSLYSMVAKETRRTLVIGAGTGEEIKTFVNIRKDVLIDALEPSFDMISVLKDNLVNSNMELEKVKLYQSTLSDFNSRDEYDFITSILVTHFIPYNEKNDYYQKINSLLCASGKAVIVEAFLEKSMTEDINYNLWIEDLKKHGFDDEQIARVVSNFRNNFYPLSFSEFEKKINGLGLIIVDCFWQSYLFRGFILQKKM